MKFTVVYKTISWSYKGKIKLHNIKVVAESKTDAVNKVQAKTKGKAFNIKVEEIKDEKDT